MNRPKLKVIFVPLLFSVILASYGFKQDAHKDLGSIQVKKGVTVSQLNKLKFGSKDTLVLRDYMEGLFGEADLDKYKKHDFDRSRIKDLLSSEQSGVNSSGLPTTQNGTRTGC